MFPCARMLLLMPALLAGLAAPLGATSYVRVSDEALVDQALRIVVARIARIEPGGVATEYSARVERALKGGGEGELLRLRVPGGSGRDGLALRIHGAPVFRPGERVLLFLEPAGAPADTVWRPLHLFLGAFHEITDSDIAAGGRRLAVRDLSEVSEIRVSESGVKALPPAPDRPRDFDAFARWAAARAAGNPRPADYFAAPAKFTFFTDPRDGEPLRWFDFDRGASVEWRALAAGQEGIAGGGYAELQAALGAWNGDPLTAVDYRYEGTTDSTAGLDRYDEVNSVVFNDPSGFIPPFNCQSGGVLAIGGPWYETTAVLHEGKPFHRIVKADVVVADALACFFGRSASPGKLMAEILAHELGHTLGLGHSCGDAGRPRCESDPVLDQALMRAFIHDDGRGARLEADDVAGLRALYGSSLPPPLAPVRLTAAVLSPVEVELTWKDRATDETEYRVEARTVDGEFADVGAVRAGSTAAIVQGLAPATGYVFRVRAGRSGIFSAYSNEARVATDAQTGPCVAGATTLCLAGRFSARVSWTPPGGEARPGLVSPSASGSSGLFWFFDPDYLELMVKLVDGCAANGRFWVYTGPSTHLQFLLTVTDTETGKTRVYFNPQGVQAPPVADVTAFGGCR
ncbi:MAG TPA: fibronectin type III domain-containing protein [Thermoanaerobaculia bacterium]|jgi:hypothetical protein|nr:fibronectin type III domain-containing protein [Thermoanaerobaculia bacterium]